MSINTDVLSNSTGITALDGEMRRGVEALEAGDKAAAYDIFHQAALRNPDVAELWVWVGGASPDLDTAQEAFRRAQELDPSNEEANLGLRWVDLKQRDSVWSGRQVKLSSEFAPPPQAAAPASPIEDPVRAAALANAGKEPERKPGAVTLFGDLEMPVAVAVLLALVVIALISAIVYFAFFR